MLEIKLFRIYDFLIKSTNAQDMPQLRSTTFPKHQKRRDETNNDKTNASYEIKSEDTKEMS